jgi:hypothetical protein
MTALARLVERVWHGPRTKRRNATHHQPHPTTHACLTTRRTR